MAVLTDNYTAIPLCPSCLKNRKKCNRIISYTFWVVTAMCLGRLFHGEGVVLWASFSSPSPCPPGYVTQYKTVGGRRWIAHCPPTLWSFFWMASSDPDDKPGGRRLPAAASGPLADGQALRFPAWVPSRCVSCFFCLWASSFLSRVFFTQSHFGPEELAGSYLRSGSYVLPLLYIFAQRCLDLKAYKKIVSGLSPWRPGCWAGLLGRRDWRNKSCCALTPPFAFYPNIFSYANKKFT